MITRAFADCTGCGCGPNPTIPCTLGTDVDLYVAGAIALVLGALIVVHLVRRRP